MGDFNVVCIRYYSAPTIHQAIISAKTEMNVQEKSHIRMVCNAAGALLPTLAISLRDTFEGALVLPSYGMTE
jgi:acyl-CoA synthetase (AMP-forming)/AMP-acid ligase II